MVRFFTLLALIVLFAKKIKAQQTETSCFYQYTEIFEKRGVYPIKDGENKVVITFRKEGYTECYEGSAKVGNNMVNIYEMYLTFEDGTKEKIQKSFKSNRTSVPIIRGISEAIFTKEDELINVFFVKNIKPKKKKYKKASPIHLK